MSKDCLFSATVSNIDYAGMVFTYFLDFKNKSFTEKTTTVPFGKGCQMPDKVDSTVEYRDGNSSILFLHRTGYTHIKVNYADFNGKPLEANIKVVYPNGHETLNVVVPWSDKKFQFTSKHECLPAEGTLQLGSETYTFSLEDSFACLDFGRGIWPYKVGWNWANASGVSDGKHIGLNFGARWTDGTGMTENGFVVDGKLTKLSEDVEFEYDKKDLMKPWHMRTAVTDRVDLEFTPFYERIASTNLLLIKSEVHQMVGHFSGTIRTEDGSVIRLENLPGCSEDHLGKW
jgi:hypothetical protein